MNPATSWKSYGRRWSVEEQLETRRRELLDRRSSARKRKKQSESVHSTVLMTAAYGQEQWEQDLAARWSGSWLVLAFLFAHPRSGAMQQLDERGAYFDLRSGDRWDLYFPGYFRSNDPNEMAYGSQPVGHGHASDWFFSPAGFDDLRGYVERQCDGLWKYSGETDLVLASAYIPDRGEVNVDWASTRSGRLTDPAVGTVSLTLGAIVENITRDITTGADAADFGVSRVVDGPSREEPSSAPKEFVTSVISEIVASLATKGLGLG